MKDYREVADDVFQRKEEFKRKLLIKRCRSLLILAAVIALCVGGVKLILHATAEYPSLGEPVSYPVNQVDGFELTIEKPTWSPFRGYTIRWAVTADSKEVYTFSHYWEKEPDFAFLERCVDGRWYRLNYTQDDFAFNSIEFPLGGDEAWRLQGSIVQKYSYYGTRLEAGNYRVVLRMEANDGTSHYLAAEFDVD